MENNQSNEIAIVPINWEVADEKTLGRKKAVSISFNRTRIKRRYSFKSLSFLHFKSCLNVVGFSFLGN